MGFQIELDLRNHNKLLLEENEQLQAKVAELEEENARLKAECDDIKQVQFPRKLEAVAVGWKKQLAASQAYAEQLRVALQTFIDEHEECTDADDWMAMLCSIEAHHVAEEALALPHDTSVLDAYVAERVKEAESRTGNQSPCYTIARDMAVRMWEKHYKTDAPNLEPLDDFMGVLSQISNMLTGLSNVEKITRQRDLAVETLEAVSTAKARGFGIEYAKGYADKTISAIKESEGM